MRIKLVLLSLLLIGGCQDVGSYGKQCSAPLAHWRKQSEGMNHHAIPVHVRLASDGSLTWNGVRTTEAQLSDYLDRARPMDPLPFLILSAQPDTACDRVNAVRKLMDQRYCHLRRVCGEGSGNSRDWDQVMDMPPPAELDQLGRQADAALEAAKSCTALSDMERIEGTDGTDPSHYRCRPIAREGR